MANFDFEESNTWVQVYKYIETFDPINTLQKIKTKQVIFEGFRLIDTISKLQANELIDSKLEFKGKSYLVYFEESDQQLFFEEKTELYLKYDKNTFQRNVQSQNFTHRLKLHALLDFAGLHQFECGMLETVWLEIN